jgi:MFS transporter, BCD family, chlorophyll transporter
MKFLRLALKTLRLAILRISPGWMFGLLTINFNRITIHELGATAVIVTTLVGLHHFLSPLQVVIGHFADRYPLLGYRRSPYILISGVIGALIFMALPWLSVALGNAQTIQELLAHHATFTFPTSALAMHSQPLVALLIAFLLIGMFGVAMAANGTSSAALIVETVDEEHRGTVFVTVWMTMVFSAIFSAALIGTILDEYDPAKMQFLYNLTLPIVVVTSIIGLVGMERRISQAELTNLMAKRRVETSSSNALRIFWSLVRVNPQVRFFFLFVALSMLGIFLQDAILEVFGAEVFGMKPSETAEFTKTWGTGIVVGFVVIILLAQVQVVSKKLIAIFGGVGIALGLGIIAYSALTVDVSLVLPGLLVMGVSTGLFDFGAMSLMTDMTVEGYAGLYMGMWGFSQGLGQGLANLLSGALHTGLIETNLITPSLAYAYIYSGEAVMMILAVLVLLKIQVQTFKNLSKTDISTVIAFETTT